MEVTFGEDKSKQIIESFTKFFTENYQSELIEILESPDTIISYAVYIDLYEIIIPLKKDCSAFLNDAPTYLNYMKLALHDAQKHLIELFVNASESNKKLILKNKIYPRIENLPSTDEEVKPQYPSCLHANKFISFNGTVTKAFKPNVLEYSQKYTCLKCGLEFKNEVNYGHQDLLVKPGKCPNRDCESTKFKQSEFADRDFKCKARDYQEIKVQEKLDFFSNGEVPRTLYVILEDDLVDQCKPGDDVTINGIIIKRWGRLSEKMRCPIDLILHANYLKVENQDDNDIKLTKKDEEEFDEFWHQFSSRPFTARNIILRSICPQLYGMYIVKLAVTLIISGGVSRKDASGTRARGESHLLLVGDPGTGKSQFLKYAAKLVPRSVITTGMGSSSAGLTASASRDGGTWHLEAGALVLADGGLCCVDEFNCMKESDRSSMLEAMEQQSLSVAKAGMVCKLKTECAVLAACNPKGHYDSDQPLTVNIALPTPLLSRFDLVLLLLDTPNEEWDKLACAYLLQGKDLLRGKNNENDKKFQKWPFEKLKLYLNYVKTLRPNLTPDANAVLQRYYVMQRQSEERKVANTTVRMFESILRLSQAHAKLMLRNEVLVMDAIVVITLLECSLSKTAQFNNVNILHTAFPNDAEIEYMGQVEIIFKKLNLPEIYEREIEFIRNNFEPFCEINSNSNSRSNSNNKYNNENDDELIQPTQNNFDIISQLASNLPPMTQMAHRFQNSKKFNTNKNINSQNENRQNSQFFRLEKPNNSVIIESQQQQLLKQDLNNTINNNNNLKKRKVNESLLTIIREEQEKEKNDCINLTNITKNDDEVFKRPNLNKTPNKLVNKQPLKSSQANCTGSLSSQSVLNNSILNCTNNGAKKMDLNDLDDADFDIDF